eukprot:1129606-Pyramimonas_sp.AAC.1
MPQVLRSQRGYSMDRMPYVPAALALELRGHVQHGSRRGADELGGCDQGRRRQHDARCRRGVRLERSG